MKLSKIFWGLLLAYVALASIYTFATPIFEKPDENWHFAVAMHILETGQLPQNTADASLHYSRQQANQPPLYYLTLATALRVTGFQDLTTGFLQLSNPNEQFLPSTPPHPQDNRRLFIQGRCEDDCLRTRNAVYLGRALSAFYVGLSLAFIALTMQEIFPNEKALSLVTIALIGFNPQILHIGTSVSNDGLSILLMSIGFYLASLWLHGKRDTRLLVLMGLVAGAALITKLSAATLGLMFGALILFTSQKRIRDIAIYGVTSLAISAWWFIYNIVLYNDPTALDSHINLAPQQAAPETISALLSQLPTVGRSFWAEFGWGQIQLPNLLYNIMFVVLGILSLISLASMIHKWRKLSPRQHQFLLFSVASLGIVFLLMLRWMSITHAPHGRLLFPAIFPIALFLAFGIVGFFRGRQQSYVMTTVSAGLIAIAAILPFRFIMPVYQALDIVTTPVLQVEFVNFSEPNGGNMSVRDVALIEDDDTIYMQLSWEINRVIADDYLVFIHILDDTGNITTQRDSYPGLSNMPFSNMKIGQIFHDVYPLANPNSRVTAVRIGVYKFGDAPNTWERLEAHSEQFEVNDNAVTIPRAFIRYEFLH